MISQVPGGRYDNWYMSGYKTLIMATNMVIDDTGCGLLCKGSHDSA